MSFDGIDSHIVFSADSTESVTIADFHRGCGFPSGLAQAYLRALFRNAQAFTYKNSASPEFICSFNRRHTHAKLSGYVIEVIPSSNFISV